MTYTIYLEDEQKSLILDIIISKFGHLEGGSRPLTFEFYNLVLENPIKALKKFPEYLDKARHINPARSLAEALDEKPRPSIPMLDILGSVYPYLDRNTRKKGLELSVASLEKLNHFSAQDNMKYIHEPWLASDIIINRPAYECGYIQYANLLEKNKSWKDFEKATGNSIPSKFWLSYAVIQPRYSTIEVRSHFYKENPELIDRTLDAAAAMIKTSSDKDARLNDLPLEEGINEKITLIEPIFHERIKKKMKEERWIILK